MGEAGRECLTCRDWGWVRTVVLNGVPRVVPTPPPVHEDLHVLEVGRPRRCAECFAGDEQAQVAI